MKKTFLLFVLGASVLSASAQLTLGTSPYNQDFNGLPSMPTGWSVYTGASETGTSQLGTVRSIDTHIGLPYMLGSDTSCVSYVVGGYFRNYPSGNVLNESSNFCLATPPTFSDRALGVRQVDVANTNFPNSDPGAAFVLKLNNTTGLSAFKLAFKLQSLDSSSPRTTDWTVDYSTAATPTFIAATATGTMTTGGKTFTNNPISVDFGSALDNKSTPVYIRIVALTTTSGAGRRATTAIDDFKLTYTGTGTAVNDVAAQPQIDLSVLGEATSNKITFAYATEESGKYNFAIYDMTGRTVHQEMVNTTSGAESLTLTGLNLAPGMYIVKMNNAVASSVAKVIVQ